MAGPLPAPARRVELDFQPPRGHGRRFTWTPPDGFSIMAGMSDWPRTPVKRRPHPVPNLTLQV
jgi:hypothetical protein